MNYAEACAAYERSKNSHVALVLDDTGAGFCCVSGTDALQAGIDCVRYRELRGMFRTRREWVARRWQLHMLWRYA